MTDPGQYQLVFGNGASMDILRDGEADLVFSSPPYYPDPIEPLLRAPIREQTEIERVRTEVTGLAYGLRPVYHEIRRVLKPGGALVVQVKDIHYGGVLIPLAPLHRELAESTGLYLLSRLFWHKFNRRSAARRFPKHPVVGAFRTDEVEEVMIFSDRNIPGRTDARVELSDEEIALCGSPFWTMAPAGSRRYHPHQSPRTLVRRMIALFTVPGDLVVDPFAGGGTTLRVAVSMGRRAVGYEIKEEYARIADGSLGSPVED